MQWSTPDKTNLKRLKAIQQELEDIIKNMEEGNNNDNEYINNDLFSKSRYSHKSRTTMKVNVDDNNLSLDENKQVNIQT